MIQSCLRSSNDPKMMWLTSFGGCRTGTKIIIINYFSLFWLHQKRWLFGGTIRNGFRKWNDSSFPWFQKRSKWSPTLKSCLKIVYYLLINLFLQCCVTEFSGHTRPDLFPRSCPNPYRKTLFYSCPCPKRCPKCQKSCLFRTPVRTHGRVRRSPLCKYLYAIRLVVHRMATVTFRQRQNCW